MKNRWFMVCALVIIVILISSGCGISRSEYDAAAIELKMVKQDQQALQTQLQEAQSELIDTRVDLVRVQAELETTQTEFKTAQADLKTAQTQLQETQSQLTAAKNNLENAQAQVQSLQNDLSVARNIPDSALSYAEFMDILMYEVWMVAGVTPNFTFSNEWEYQTALENRAASSGDAQLINFVVQIEAGPIDKDTIYHMCYYCLNQLEKTLK